MSTSFFVVPSFAPPTLEQLASEPDDVAIIVRQEAKITQQVGAGRPRRPPTWPCPARAAHPPAAPAAPAFQPQLEEVREYHREVEPLGVIAAQEELEESEADGDEGLTSDEGARAAALPPRSAAPAAWLALLVDI